MQIGCAVISKKGSDAGKTYLVIGFADNGYALVCDGKRHKLCSPKKKNVKHLSETGAMLETPTTDAAIVTAIRRLVPSKNN